MNEIKKIAVLTSGGDAPGMNSAVRAVVFSANNLGIEVVGVLRGYEGLIDWETVPLGLDDVRNINNQGGTILFTSRSERFLDQKYRHTAAENLRAHDVDAVVAIGGDGTLRGAIIKFDKIKAKDGSFKSGDYDLKDYWKAYGRDDLAELL